jgi:hypothetical protein
MMNIKGEGMFAQAKRHGANATQCFRAAIVAPFHNGEAVVKYDRQNQTWKCLFTLKNGMVGDICAMPIEERAIIRIIRDEDIERFGEYVHRIRSHVSN